MIRCIANWSVAVVALFVLGCGDGNRTKTAPVSGTVHLDGQPLKGAEINFFCETTNHLGSGITDAKGHYQLYPSGGVGANIVWVSTAKFNAVNPPEPSELGFGLFGERISNKYNNENSTVLKFEIPGEGTDKADFRVTSGSESELHKTDTGKTDTGKTDTGKTDTGKTDTGKADTGKADTGKTDTGKTDTGKADTGKTDKGGSK